MGAQELEDLLQLVIETYNETTEEDSEFLNVMTFSDAGVMTYNKGLVIRTKDGSEFQVSIVQSR